MFYLLTYTMKMLSYFAVQHKLYLGEMIMANTIYNLVRTIEDHGEVEYEGVVYTSIEQVQADLGE